MRPAILLALLNEVDMTVDSVRKQLAEVTAALREPPALAETRRALADAAAELARCRARQEEHEAAQHKAEARLATAQETLYSGRVKSPRELEGVERDVAQLRHQQAAVEDRLLEAIIALEDAERRHAALAEEEERLAAEWAVSQSELRARQAQLRVRLSEEQARQVTARGRVPAEFLAIYDRLHGKRGGRVVVALDGDDCSACRVAVPPTKLEAARYGDELIYCGNCGRILWGE